MHENSLDNLVVMMSCGHEELLVDILVDRIIAQRGEKEQAVQILVNEVAALYHLLRVVVARIHSDANLTTAARGLLRRLDRIGPQTVPEMARARPVSRQYIQAVVKQLGKRELVQLVPNPAHKRSSLVQLTSKGKRLAEAVARKEKAFLAELQIDLSKKELLLASSVMRKLRECFLQILRDRIAGEGLK